MGASYSNQLWDYKMITINNTNKDFKIGFTAFLTAEKRINKIFSIRPEIGYIQKGFKNNYDLVFPSGNAGVDKKNVIFHNLAADLGLKITPFDLKFVPYFLVGLRGDYMFSYKDIVAVEQGSGFKFNMYKSQIDEFKKFNLGGLIGLGYEFNETVYMEIEYNPSFTSSFNDTGLQIKDNCWDIKLGFNLNRLHTK